MRNTRATRYDANGQPVAVADTAPLATEGMSVGTVGPEPTPNASDAPAKRSKARVWIPIVSAVVALFLGTAIGGSGSASTIADLRANEESLTSDVAQLEVSEQRATEKLDTAVKSEAAGADKLRTARSELTAAKAEGDTLRARVAELEQQLSEAQTAAAEATAAAERAAANAPAPFAAAPPAPSGNEGSVYYKNCAAARAAGAAPVYQGQPGYGRHLDRDGDGIGCE